MSVPAYPLQWPAGWRRTDKSARASARFSKQERQSRALGDGTTSSWMTHKQLSVADAVKRVRLVLEQMGVSDDDLVISSNVALRLDGQPLSGQPEPSDPGVAVYWRHRGQTRSMAIDRYDRVADNLAAVAATLDAMRVVARHGGAEIGDRAYTGFSALPAPESTPWWVEFGYDSHEMLMSMARHDADASAQSVNAALRDIIAPVYKRMRSEHHPDNGGDAYRFNRVQRAWEAFEREHGNG